MISSPNGPLDGASGPEGGDHDKLADFPAGGRPGHRFCRVHWSTSRQASENRYGKGRETDDRSSPKLIEYLAIGFVAMAVAFGPAIAALL